jgi:hypothetical protein
LISEPRSFTSSSKRGELREQWIKREDLARAALAGGGDRRQGRAVEHRCDGLRDARRRGGVALQIIREPREHDAAHHAIGQVVAERGRRRERLEARVPVALLGVRAAGSRARPWRW